MKLRLPISLLSAVLAVFTIAASGAHAVEVPEDYASNYLSDPDELNTHKTSSDNLAFLLDNSVTFAPSTATWWQSTYLKRNGSVLFTIEEDMDPVSLTFEKGIYSALNVSSLRVEDIGRLTFSDIKSTTSDSVNPAGTSSSYDYHCKGGAVSGQEMQMLRNGAVTFADNRAVWETAYVASSSTYHNHAYGGAIYAGSAASTVLVESNTGLISFSGNVAKASNAWSSSSSASSSNNYARHNSYSYGGAIYAGADSLVSLSRNARGLDISKNQALSSESISFSRSRSNSLYVTSESSTVTYGGAIYGGSASEIRLDGNAGGVSIGENAAASEVSSYSSADTDYYSSYTTESNATSKAYSYGGALYSEADSGISVSSNIGGVSLCGNHASALSSAEAHVDSYSSPSAYAYTTSRSEAYGGAVYGSAGTTIELDGNAGGLTISGNYAQASSSCKNTFNYSGTHGANSTDSVAIARGGAIYSGSKSQLSISDNTGAVLISGNYVSVTSTSSSGLYLAGGAIYSEGSIDIRNNDTVLFTGNYEKQTYGTSRESYRLRSIYMNSGAADGGTFALSAAAGNSITFEDSIYVATSTSGQAVGVNFNAAYTVGETSLDQAGDIIFDGGKVAATLENIKGSAATASEILNSQTSYMGGQIKLQAGRLVVRDGAQLNGVGLATTARSGAALVLENAGMKHSGSISLKRGTALELSGVNTMVSTTLSLATSSTLRFALSGANRDAAVLSLDANMEHFSITLALDGADMLASGRYKLVELSDASQYVDNGYWNADRITVSATGDAAGLGFDDLVWEDGVLYVEQGKSIWTNADGDGTWNTTSTNWSRNGQDITYRDGMDVLFDGTAAGTVQLEGEVAPLSVTVENAAGQDYTFSGSGKLTGSTSIVKNGEGELSLATANEHTGGTQLNGGSLRVQHSSALGATTATLSTAAGSRLSIENGAQVVLAAAEGNDLAGSVSIAAGASLEMQGSGYRAESTQLAGELIFNNTGVSQQAGSLSGSGHLKVQGAGTAVQFASAASYAGSVSLANGATLTTDMLKVGADATLAALAAGTSVSLGDVVGTGAAQVEMQTTKFESYTGTFNADVAANTYTAGTLSTEGGLVLQGGTTYQANGSSIDLGGSTLTMAGNAENPFISLMLELDKGYTPVDTQIVLFSGVSAFNVGGVEFSSAETAYVFSASDYLKGEYVFETTALVYDGNVGVVYLVEAVPEPATTTLSLLALAGLAARRRRKE